MVRMKWPLKYAFTNVIVSLFNENLCFPNQAHVYETKEGLRGAMIDELTQTPQFVNYCDNND